MTLPNEIDLTTTGLTENERVLAEDWSRCTIQFYVSRSVYGSKDSMQHLIAFRDHNPIKSRMKKLYISSYKRATENIIFQRDN